MARVRDDMAQRQVDLEPTLTAMGQTATIRLRPCLHWLGSEYQYWVPDHAAWWVRRLLRIRRAIGVITIAGGKWWVMWLWGSARRVFPRKSWGFKWGE